MSHHSNADVIRELLESYSRQDWPTFESLLADGFTFSSPDDPELDREGYFQRCWPGSRLEPKFEIERIFSDGNESFVLYNVSFADQPPFRNTEFMRFEDGKVKRVEVYYGVGTVSEMDVEDDEVD